MTSSMYIRMYILVLLDEYQHGNKTFKDKEIIITTKL